MEILSAVFLGLSRAQEQLITTANNIGAGDLDALPGDLMQLSIAKAQHAAALAVLRTSNQMQSSLLDLIV